MKRNMELIRDILQFAEDQCDGRGEPIITVACLPEKYHHLDEFVLKEHLAMAEEAGLIMVSGAFGDWSIRRMTNAGHDFLGNSRSPKVWNTAKRIAGQRSVAFFTGVLEKLAIARANELVDNLIAMAKSRYT